MVEDNVIPVYQKKQGGGKVILSLPFNLDQLFVQGLSALALSDILSFRSYYANNKITKQFTVRLDSLFKQKVEIPRVRVGKRQEIETLITEEALLFAKYLRGEKAHWTPRIPELV